MATIHLLSTTHPATPVVLQIAHETRLGVIHHVRWRMTLAGVVESRGSCVRDTRRHQVRIATTLLVGLHDVVVWQTFITKVFDVD